MDDSFVLRLGEEARNILVVDDEPIILKALDKYLSRFHYKVHKAEHAVDAMKILREIRVGVIITDYQMPMLSGLEFLQQAKTIQPLATRILITAIQDNETVVQAINDGEIFRFITKPWKGEELIATIHNAAQKFDLSQKNEELREKTLAANEDLRRQLELVEKQKAELQESIENSIRLSLRTVEIYQPELGERARKVQEVAQRIGKEMGCTAHQMLQIRIASLIHEIGMISLSRELIKKWESSPSQLSETEKQSIQKYPLLSEELGAYVDSSGEISKIVRQHCEQFDGSGFPDGLRNEYIHIVARIIHVASYLVMSPNPPQTTMEVLEAGSGKRFDPEIVRACVRMRILEITSEPSNQKQVLIQELQNGMVLAESLTTEEGTLLMLKGEKLNPAFIKIIQNHNNLSNIRSSIAVEA